MIVLVVLFQVIDSTEKRKHSKPGRCYLRTQTDDGQIFGLAEQPKAEMPNLHSLCKQTNSLTC